MKTILDIIELFIGTTVVTFSFIGLFHIVMEVTK